MLFLQLIKHTTCNKLLFTVDFTVVETLTTRQDNAEFMVKKKQQQKNTQ